jgi:hypothetical protein
MAQRIWKVSQTVPTPLVLQVTETVDKSSCTVAEQAVLFILAGACSWCPCINWTHSCAWRIDTSARQRILQYIHVMSQYDVSKQALASRAASAGCGGLRNAMQAAAAAPAGVMYEGDDDDDPGPGLHHPPLKS